MIHLPETNTSLAFFLSLSFFSLLQDMESYVAGPSPKPEDGRCSVSTYVNRKKYGLPFQVPSIFQDVCLPEFESIQFLTPVDIIALYCLSLVKVP